MATCLREMGTQLLPPRQSVKQEINGQPLEADTPQPPFFIISPSFAQKLFCCQRDNWGMEWLQVCVLDWEDWDRQQHCMLEERGPECAEDQAGVCASPRMLHQGWQGWEVFGIPVSLPPIEGYSRGKRLAPPGPWAV
jgi:hypothetical protein